MTVRLSNRRGAILVLAAFLMVVVLGMLVVVVDMSRMYAQKNELQTAADAGALAGVMELLVGSPEVVVKDSAVSFSQKNQVLKQNITVSTADVICGVWDEATRTYLGDAAQCGSAENTVAVTTRGAANYIFPLFMNSNVQLVATARAFAANVGVTKCVKPWAIPYDTLTRTLQPTNPDVYRNLDALDLQQLTELSVADRTFELKIGSPPDAGNFGSLDVPDPNYPRLNGKALYSSNIIKCNGTPIGPGSVLDTETGGAVGPTRKSLEEFCAAEGTYNNVTGNCYDTNNELGIVAKAALWSQRTDKGNGKYSVTVRQIVSFRLTNLSQKNGESIVTGYFLPIITSGGITPLKTTIKRPILVS